MLHLHVWFLRQMETKCLGQCTLFCNPMSKEMRMMNKSSYFNLQEQFYFRLQNQKLGRRRSIGCTLLLTMTTMDVPSNLEARRWISFFSNSFFIEMPSAPKRKMYRL